MALILKPDGSIVTLTPAKGKKLSYEEMSKAVGGMIEHIPYKFKKGAKETLPLNAAGKRPSTGWCNEMGKLTPPVILNARATRLFDTYSDCLTGDILLTYPGES